MRDLHDRVQHRGRGAVPALHAHLPHGLHRRLAHAELHLPQLHGAGGRRPPGSVSVVTLNMISGLHELA